MAVRDVFVRNPHNYDVDQASDDSAVHCLDESLARQSEKDDADINVIVRRFGLTGHLPVVERPPLVGDFSEAVTDYGTALRLIRAADSSFMQLSADVRARFDHDPAKFVDFVSDPANLEECRKMGLAEPKKEVSDVRVQAEVRQDAGENRGAAQGGGGGEVSRSQAGGVVSGVSAGQAVGSPRAG